MGLLGIMFNNAYIRWKVLLGLGTGFWALLCLYDAYILDPSAKVYCTELEDEWLSQVSEEEIVSERVSFGREDEIHFPEDKHGLIFYLALWNVLTFVISFVACGVGKLALVYWWKFKNISEQAIELGNVEQSLKKSCSKIPVPRGSKSATTNTLDSFDDTSEKEDHPDSNDHFLKDGSETPPANRPNILRASFTSIDLSVRQSKNEESSRSQQQMEKRCAKLRDEMILIQASSLKEHAALSRKLELVTKEKRDLCRQLMLAQKENRAAKQQLEELLSEKAMLLKRLECASKEFKSNTKSKKQALEKLEDSQTTIGALQQELEKITREKETLKNNLQVLDVEYRLMKDRLAKHEAPSENFRSTENSTSGVKTESKQDVPQINQTVSNLARDFKKSDVTDMSQSHKDVQRVQMRLINLEKNLNKLKLCRWVTHDGEKKSINDAGLIDQGSLNPVHSESDQEFHDANLISTLPENDNNVNMDISTPSDNLTDEQRRKILAPGESSGDESCSNSKRLDDLMEHYQHLEHPFERTGNILHILQSNPSPRGDTFDLSGSDFPVNETSTSVNEDDDTDEWEPPKNRFIRKPLMEKKRRARINDSLETLKQILLDSKTTLKESTQRKTGQRSAKLEKADILEMTVQYLQHLHNKLGQIQGPPPAKTKEEVLIRPADSSCESGLKIGVTLIPTRLENGDLAFVVPTMQNVTNKDEFQKEISERLAVKAAESVWRPW